MERLHPFVAGIVANVLGSLVGAVLLSLAGYSGVIDSIGQFAGATASVAFYSFLIALPFVYLYGMPLYSLLRRLGVANLVTGALVGAAPGVIWILWTGGSWIDAALWNGALIAIAYVYLRGLLAAPSNSSLQSDAQERGARLS